MADINRCCAGGAAFIVDAPHRALQGAEGRKRILGAEAFVAVDVGIVFRFCERRAGRIGVVICIRQPIGRIRGIIIFKDGYFAVLKLVFIRKIHQRIYP